MAQAAEKMIETQAQPVAVSPFAKALASLREAKSAHDFAKEESKEAAKAVTAAERVAQWIAFDLAVKAEVPGDAAEAFAEEIAAVKGLEGASLRVYRQRFRDAVTTYRAACLEADRAKATPLTVAKRLREQGAKAAVSAIEVGDLTPAALEIAAEALETDVDEVKRLVNAKDDEAVSCFAAAMVTAKTRATIVAEARALLARLADCDADTQEEVRALFAA